MNARDLRIARKGIPTPAQLEYVAGSGESERVRVLLGRVPARERDRYAGRYVLSEAVRGGLSRLRAIPPPSPGRIRRERAFIDDALGRFLSWCRREAVYPRELFRCLLEWSSELLNASHLDEALATSDLALRLGAKAFPDLYPRLVLQRAAVLSARGQLGEARAAQSALYERLDLVADRDILPDLILDLGRSSLLTGQAALFKRLLFDGLHAFYVDLEKRRTIVRLLRRAHRGTLGLLLSPEPTPSDKLVFLAHWLCLGLARSFRSRVLSRPLERGLLGVLYTARYAWSGRGPGRAWPRPAPRAPRAGILVTRAMGGIGDLLMMTPGLHALKLRAPARPLHLALPRRFFPLFEGNDDVELLDIHGEELQPRSYEAWLNLTDCPAARAESLAAPRVRRNRIEIFARALGVGSGALRRMDRRPRYFPSPAELQERERFFAAHGLAGASVIGVQLRSDESYRDYPHMPSLVEALSQEHRVLVFDDRPIAGYDLPNTVKVEARPFREAAALLSGCRAVVAPDSSFVHLAGALGLPCVGLFGPTDGAVRTRDYPSCRFVDVRLSLRCVPCWRNEVIPCALTGSRASACLHHLAIQPVVAALQALLAATAPAASGRRPGRGEGG